MMENYNKINVFEVFQAIISALVVITMKLRSFLQTVTRLLMQWKRIVLHPLVPKLVVTIWSPTAQFAVMS